MEIGSGWSFAFAVASPVCWVILRLSFDASALLQSRISMEIVIDVLTCVVDDDTYTCELADVAVPAQLRGPDVGTGA